MVAIFVDGFNSYYVDKYMKVESAVFKDLIPSLEKRYDFNINMGIHLSHLMSLKKQLKNI